MSASSLLRQVDHCIFWYLWLLARIPRNFFRDNPCVVIQQINLPRLFFSLGGGAGIGPIMSSSSSSSLFSAASKPRFLLPSSAILKLQRNLTGQRRMRFKYAQAQIDAPLGNLSIYTPPSTDGNQWLTWNARSIITGQRLSTFTSFWTESKLLLLSGKQFIQFAMNCYW